MKRHPFRPTPFVIGVLFGVLAVLFALDSAGEADLDLRWIPAVVLLGLGLAVLLGGIRPARIRVPDPSAPLGKSDLDGEVSD